MTECFSCGASKGEEVLHEAIYKTGVVRVCLNCSEKFNLPIIKKKEVDWKKVDESGSVRERLSNMAHVNVHETKFAKKPEDVKLRDIVEKNLKEKRNAVKSSADDLIYNFHWVIMRKRRALGFTRAKFALKIGESEDVVKALEAGSLPTDYKELISKVEKVMDTSLFKVKRVKVAQPESDIVDGLDDDIVVEEKGSSFFSKFWKNVKESFFVNEDEFVEDLEVSENVESVEVVDAKIKVEGAVVEVEPAQSEVLVQKNIRTTDYRERLAERARIRADEMRQIRQDRAAIKASEERMATVAKRNDISNYSAEIAMKNAEIARINSNRTDYAQKKIDDLKAGVIGTKPEKKVEAIEEFDDIVQDVQSAEPVESVINHGLPAEPMVLEEEEYEKEEPSYEDQMSKLNPVELPESRQAELEVEPKEELSDDDIHKFAWGGK
jgi:ribosome-binding protein aMBF1 (putative translation factor)